MYEMHEEERFYDSRKLESELSDLVEQEGLSLSELEQQGLPEIMSREHHFGLNKKDGAPQLDANQFELWRERVLAWLTTAKGTNVHPHWGVKRMDVGIPRHPAPLRVAKN